jgi:CheY-like chemotaxis protein
MMQRDVFGGVFGGVFGDLSEEPRYSPLVLIADDSPTMRIVTRHALERAGLQTIEVATPLEVLAAAREILQRLLEGETDAQALAELARSEAPRQAGSTRPGGRWPAAGASCLPGTREQLVHLDYLGLSGCRHCASGR